MTECVCMWVSHTWKGRESLSSLRTHWNNAPFSAVCRSYTRRLARPLASQIHNTRNKTKKNTTDTTASSESSKPGVCVCVMCVFFSFLLFDTLFLHSIPRYVVIFKVCFRYSIEIWDCALSVRAFFLFQLWRTCHAFSNCYTAFFLFSARFYSYNVCYKYYVGNALFVSLIFRLHTFFIHSLSLSLPLATSILRVECHRFHTTISKKNHISLLILYPRLSLSFRFVLSSSPHTLSHLGGYTYAFCEKI